MLGAIYIGLSGMDAYSKGLQTISNNVSNLNSPGFKSTTTSFTDVFNVGREGLAFSNGADADQTGDGVRFAPAHIDFKQGDLRQSTGDLDLAIQGEGFLVLQDGSKTLYARTGQFSIDKDGYITQQDTQNRLTVLDSNNRPVAVNVDSKRTSAPAATTKITFADNLSSSATTATVSNVAVYDSLGNKQVWQIKFDAVTATPGSWTVTVTDQTSRTVGTSTLKFISGTVDPANSTVAITDSPTGAAPLSVSLDFSSGVTSFSSGTTSTLRAASVDGNATGALTTVTVDSDGKIKLSYRLLPTRVPNPISACAIVC